MDWFGSASFIGILSLLYFGLIPKDWHFIEDIKQMVVPFTILSLFSGALVFVLPWSKNEYNSCSTVFLIGFLIAFVAIAMHILLMTKVHFRPIIIPEHEDIPKWFYGLVAIISSIFFGLGTISGYISAYFMTHAISKLNLLGEIENNQRSDIVVKCAIAFISVIGAVLTSLFGGHGS